jgi:hypothetical protein
MGDVLIVGMGAVLLTWPANVIVRTVLRLARAQGTRPVGAGRWIGALERLVIFVLVITGEPGTAGLVVAAKSILRYPELTGSKPTIDPEYVLVGSLTSWLIGFAIAAGVAALVG